MANKIIRGIFLVITLMLLSVSVYYSRGWHNFVQMPPWIAWGLSGAFVAGSIVFFDISIGNIIKAINLDKKTEKYGKIIAILISVSVFFILVWLILTTYSMYSTLAGQFNKMLLSDTTVYTVTESDQEIKTLELKLESIKNPAQISDDSKKILIEDIDNQTKELIDEKGIINNMISDTSGAQEAAEFRSAIRDAYSRLEVIETELKRLSTEKRIMLLPVEIPDTSELESEIRELKNKNNENLTDKEKLALQDDIFDFISKIFNTEPRTIQFIALAFPSILVDLLSPIFSALFFYGFHKSKSYQDGRDDAFSEIDAELAVRLASK